MTSDQIRGNEGVVKALFGMVDAGKVPNAILLQDEDGGQAMEICLAFVRYLYCHSHVNGSFCGECPQCNKTGKLIHPDVHFIFPTASSMLSAQFSRQFRELALSNPRFTEDELSAALGIEGKKQMIGVDEAKYLLDELSVSSLEGGFRTVVVFLPEYMNAEAANRLLKSVEEPDSKTVFVMITHHPEKVLQTISSRCQRIMVAGSGCGAPVSCCLTLCVRGIFLRLLMWPIPLRGCLRGTLQNRFVNLPRFPSGRFFLSNRDFLPIPPRKLQGGAHLPCLRVFRAMPFQYLMMRPGKLI